MFIGKQGGESLKKHVYGVVVKEIFCLALAIETNIIFEMKFIPQFSSNSLF